jgi:hypothetical protein
MPKGAEFYSVNEIEKSPADRAHHTNRACTPGRDISEYERRLGAGGYRLCHVCKELNDRWR